MSATTTAPSQAIFWGLVLILAIIVLGVFVWLVRRWVFRTSEEAEEETWTLQHLRELKAAGQITDAEFETLKAKLLESARGAMEGDGKKTPTPRRIDPKIEEIKPPADRSR